MTRDYKNTYVSNRVSLLFPQLLALATYDNLEDRKNGKGKNMGWLNLAIFEASHLRAKYPDNRSEEDKEYCTALKQITNLKNALNQELEKIPDKAYYHAVKNIIIEFGDMLSAQFRIYKSNQNKRYRDSVTDRRQPENRIIIDLSNALERAYEVLHALTVGRLDSTNWKEVSCALALSTGRRMAEIHKTAIFKQLSKYELEFSGQLKGKTRTVNGQALIDTNFTIPTLIDSNLIVSGLNWLERENKRLNDSEPVNVVNSRYSKQLNLHCKNWDIFPENDRTYHKFRAAYLRAVIDSNKSLDSFDFLDYAKKILCDDDENTIDSYKRYRLAENSLYRI